jgi:hypothetical protein
VEENYAILLWRAMALHLKNLANLETARGPFVTICSLTLDLEMARIMARRTKSGRAKDERR